jgi:MFS family permease
LAPAHRRLIQGVAATTAAASISGATFNFVVQPLTQDVGASEEQLSLLRQIPSIGALLVIFIAGAWGMRVGARRVVTIGSILMALGYGIVTVSPSMPVVSLGMLIGSVGRQAVFVVALGLVASRLTSQDDRAAGFAALAAVGPAIYLVAPVAATAILAVSSWRGVGALWVAAGVLAAIAARRLLPADESGPGATGELWTPALAGLALAGTVQFISNGNYDGWTAGKTLVWLAIACGSLLALLALMRRLSHPTLDLTILGTGGTRLLLLVIALVPFTNLWYYFTLSLQYIYGFTGTQSALILVPAQLAGLLGAWLARRWIPDHGIRFTGTVMLVAGSVALFLSTVQTTTLPPVVPLLILCLYATAMTGATIPLTNAIMNLAPAGGEGSASSLRGAATSLGAAIGVLMMTALVFTTYSDSLGARMAARGDDPQTAAQIADSLAKGASSEEVSAQMSVPLDDIADVADDQRQAMVDGYRAHGLAGGFIVLAAAVVFFFNRKGLTDIAADAGGSGGGPAAKARRR